MRNHLIVLSIILASTTISFIASQATPAMTHPNDKPVVVKAVAPVFPPIARAARADGKVSVEIRVNASGTAVSATAMNSHPLLRKAAEIAALRWQFAPTAEKDSRERTVTLVFVFRTLSSDALISEESVAFVPPYLIEVTEKAPVIEQHNSH